MKSRRFIRLSPTGCAGQVGAGREGNDRVQAVPVNGIANDHQD
jgi:hypothetical protein